ncbi:hypothetical protein [Deminuibacter soli]|uniref:Tetratricopeptide repeat protein n=1 Tax=Deminuibacter soli TaxID=2291815 RepID=A0A3E1NQD9_9BACT|nr:hypothetical protein [Deminuibacter soli]RFM30130.1 hypothetical protein DXN05_03915 [Deminuibacter soli]
MHPNKQAQTQMEQHQYKEALAILEHQTTEHPENFRIWHQQGMCKFHLGHSTKNKQLLLEAFNEVKHALALAAKANTPFPEAEADFAAVTATWEKDVKPYFEY